MKKEKIYECEVKRLHQIDGKRFWKWIIKSATEIEKSEKIRCNLCKGKVRLHKQRISAGPKDHVEHIHQEHSKICPNGFYFLGESMISIRPVE